MKCFKFVSVSFMLSNSHLSTLNSLLVGWQHLRGWRELHGMDRRRDLCPAAAMASQLSTAIGDGGGGGGKCVVGSTIDGWIGVPRQQRP
jgi:hypothetical protein